MKLVVPGSLVGVDAFADFFRYPEDRTEPAPLVVFTGSAISAEAYEARRLGEPTPVTEQLERAHSSLGRPPIDALILSPPPTLQEFEGSVELFRRFLAFELFPELPLPHATALGLVGNSFGAHLLTGFACRRGDAVALATISGVGMWSAIAECGGEPPPDLKIACFVNDADFAGFFAYELQEELRMRQREITLVERPGDHPYRDYVGNGSVADAFEFVLQAIVEAS